MASAIAADPASLASQIPIDLFVSKKHPGLAAGVIGFANAAGNIIYTVESVSHKTHIFPHHSRHFVLQDADGHALMTLTHKNRGCWQGYKSNGSEDLVFQAKRNSLSDGVKTQIEVFIAGPNGELDSTPTWKLKGNPSQRSCTISDDNSIMAQTSLMYKLHQICVGRTRFRLTIYPAEDADRSLIVALVVIFVYGKK
uniref:Uncharacterized protein n=1 Tax=Kalanchoe fedtschenkoi TaxID=63787 RepID=A0A7N0VIB1_KALFE